MKLKKVRIQNFRSIEDSGEFDIDHITCFVGKNESGKSSLLRAIEAVRPVDPDIAYDIERDYPRQFLTRYEARHPEKEAAVATTIWEMDNRDRGLLEKHFGAESIENSEIKIIRRYNSATEWVSPINEKKAVRHLLNRFGITSDDISNIAELETLADLALEINNVEIRSSQISQLEKSLSGYPEHSVDRATEAILEKYTPKFLYSSHYDRMSGQININTLRKHISNNKVSESDRIFLDFLEFAGTSIDDIASASTFESLNSRCQAASNTITDEIFEYWSQNQQLEIKVNVSEGKPEDPEDFRSGNIARARVYNKIHRVDVPFSERSAGFIWFFSFLVRFSQVKKEHGNLILLLDEPGLTLHGTAQRDLLKYFGEKLAEDHQVIYSTHSPFMVPPDNLLCCRTVEDIVRYDERRRERPIGTKVKSDILTSDSETLFPLQGALGYDLTQSLFVGVHTLLVEGPSDLLYLFTCSEALRKRFRTGLDPKWVLCPTGSLDKMLPFVSLFRGQRLEIAVLADVVKGHKQSIEKIRKSNLLKKENILLVSDFAEKDEADIEDLFSKSLFIDIINRTFELSGEDVLTEEKLSIYSETRIVKRVESYFRTLSPETKNFSHLSPAYWLARNIDVFDTEDPSAKETLDRFENLLKAINRLLN